MDHSKLEVSCELQRILVNYKELVELQSPELQSLGFMFLISLFEQGKNVLLLYMCYFNTHFFHSPPVEWRIVYKSKLCYCSPSCYCQLGT